MDQPVIDTQPDTLLERSVARLPRTIPDHRRQRVVVLSSYTPSLVNFRLELLRRLVQSGHRVTAVGPEDDATTKVMLSSIGVDFVQMPLARVGLNPFSDMRTVWWMWRLFRRLRPDVIIPYTMKPIIYGGIAARLAGVRSRCFLVTGLGHVFSQAGSSSVKGRALKQLSIWLYRLAFKGSKVVFAYNEADALDLRENKMFHPPTDLKLVPGSGVDLSHYAFAPATTERPIFLLIARLLKDKGIAEFVEAARQVKENHPDAQFQLLGHFDPNLSAGIAPADVTRWVDEGVVTYLGTTQDVRPYLNASNIFVLPSYYREGIPRSILEAMSVGRAIITTDLPGCNDTVAAGENGLLVAPRSVAQLAVAMNDMANDLERVRLMGRRSREIAEDRFNVHHVNSILMDRMDLENNAH